MEMWEKIISTRPFAVAPQWKAAVTALIVFFGLYLAEGLRLFGRNDLWYVLTWPWVPIGGWEYWLWHMPFKLAPGAAVALLVYQLRLRALLIAGDSMRARALESELAGRREQAERSREELGRCREELRIAVQARRDAETRASAAEANARAAERKSYAGQNRAAGGDDRFQAAKRVFARLYHPDNVKADGLDKMIRAEIFKEFWRELETIEKSAKR